MQKLAEGLSHSVIAIYVIPSDQVTDWILEEPIPGITRHQTFLVAMEYIYMRAFAYLLDTTIFSAALHHGIYMMNVDDHFELVIKP